MTVVVSSSVVAAQHFSGSQFLPKWTTFPATVTAPRFTDSFTATGTAAAGDLFIGVVVSDWPLDNVSAPTDETFLERIDCAAFAAGPGSTRTFIQQQVGVLSFDMNDPLIQGTEITKLHSAIHVGDPITAGWVNFNSGVNGDTTVGPRTYLLVAFRLSPTTENMTFDSNFFGAGGVNDMLNDGENDDGQATGTAVSGTIVSGDRDATRGGAFPRNRDGDLLAITGWADGSKTFGSVSSPWESIGQTAVAGQFGIDIHARTFPTGTASYSVSGTLSGSTAWRTIICAWAASAVVAGGVGIHAWQRL